LAVSKQQLFSSVAKAPDSIGQGLGNWLTRSKTAYTLPPSVKDSLACVRQWLQRQVEAVTSHAVLDPPHPLIWLTLSSCRLKSLGQSPRSSAHSEARPSSPGDCGGTVTSQRVLVGHVGSRCSGFPLNCRHRIIVFWSWCFSEHK